MLCLAVLCVCLCGVVCALAIKIALMRRAVREIEQGFSQRLWQDTNTLVSVSSGDKTLRSMAESLNAQLRSLRAIRRRLQSNEGELRDAIANISHDLRTPLTAIWGYLELMEKEEMSKEAHRCLAIIDGRVRHLRSLTEELFQCMLLGTAPERTAPETLSLNALIEDTLAAYYAALTERGITPSVTLPDIPILCQSDRQALSRILDNMLSNALKYSDGDLAVSLSRTGVITLSNRASALDAVTVGRLFNRYYTVQSGRGSTGLGLAIARRLTEQLGGTLSAQYQSGMLPLQLTLPRI